VWRETQRRITRKRNPIAKGRRTIPGERERERERETSRMEIRIDDRGR
jgi:hypothetical protein